MKRRSRIDVKLWVLMLLLSVVMLLPVLVKAQVPPDAADLTWDSSGPLAQKYFIYRADRNADETCSVYPAGYAKIGEVDAPTLAYRDQPLPYNTAYCWHVTAWNVDHGESGVSNVAMKRIPFPSAPLAPVNLQVQ